MLPGLSQVIGNHLLAHLLHRNLGRPAELLLGLAGVTQQGFNFRRTEVARIDFDDGLVVPVADFVNALPFPAQLHAEFGSAPFDELAHAVLHAGGDHKVFGLVLLQHHPLHAHIVLGVAPVAQGVDVAHVQAIFQAHADIGQATGDLASDKGFTPARAFVVEQNAVAGIHAVGLAVVHGDPVRVELGHGVGAARVKRRGFLLWGFLHQAIQFTGTGLVKAGFLLQTQDANGFEDAQGAHAVHVGGVFRAFKAHRHMALGAKVINFIGLGLLNNAREVARIAQVAVVQIEPGVVRVRVLVDVVHPGGVEAGGAALDAVNDIAFFQQKFGQVRAILAGNAGNEGDFGSGVGCNGHGSHSGYRLKAGMTKQKVYEWLQNERKRL